MKLSSTLFLKIVLLLGGILVSGLCLFLIRVLLFEEVGIYQPILIGMLVAAGPFFIGVYQTTKLLTYIDQKNTFTPLSIKALARIKYCGITISAIYGLGLPYIYWVAQQDDAPGVMLIGLVFAFAPLLAAVLAAVLQQIFQKAMALKSENELTV